MINDSVMPPSVEVFDLARRFVDGEIGVDGLRDWAARHTGWLMSAPSHVGTELAGLIELNLAEHDAGHAGDDEIRDDLRVFLAEREPTTVGIFGGVEVAGIAARSESTVQYGAFTTSQGLGVVSSPGMVVLHEITESAPAGPERGLLATVGA